MNNETMSHEPEKGTFIHTQDVGYLTLDHYNFYLTEKPNVWYRFWLRVFFNFKWIDRK